MLIPLLICYVLASLLPRKAIEIVLFLVLYECIQLYHQDITAAQKLVSILRAQQIWTAKCKFICLYV